MRDLIEKAKVLRWRNNNRTVRYLIVVRGGFSQDYLRFMEDQGIDHWTLDDLSTLFWGA